MHDPNAPGASVATHLAHAYDAHEWNATIAQLAEMAPGHIAERSGPGDPWVIKTLVGWDD